MSKITQENKANNYILTPNIITEQDELIDYDFKFKNIKLKDHQRATVLKMVKHEQSKMVRINIKNNYKYIKEIFRDICPKDNLSNRNNFNSRDKKTLYLYNNIGILANQVGSGKCHSYNTPILMGDGLIKMVQDIKVGEYLMGDDSIPRKVLSLGRGKDKMYEIKPSQFWNIIVISTLLTDGGELFVTYLTNKGLIDQINSVYSIWAQKL